MANCMKFSKKRLYSRSYIYSYVYVYSKYFKKKKKINFIKNVCEQLIFI